MTSKAKKLVSQPLALAFTFVLFALALTAAPSLASAAETPVTLSPTGITGHSAILHGELNPHAPGEPGEWQFKYKESTEICHPEAKARPQPPGVALGNEKEIVSYELNNLEPGHTYTYCVIANPETESVFGAPVTFTTLPVSEPYIFVGSTVASNVTPFAASLEASINPEREPTTYFFEYATTEKTVAEGKGTVIAGAGPLPAEFAEIPVSVSVSGLTPSTPYFFRVVATNATGTTTGPVVEFTTRAAEAPGVVSETVAQLNSSEPKFEAKINPDYEETSYYFEYATNEAFTENRGVAHGAPPAADLPAVFEAEGLSTAPAGVTGLQPVTYYYRVVAENQTSKKEGKPSDGPVQSFVAFAIPAVTTGAAGETTRTTARVSGMLTPQGLPTTYYFAYVPAADYRPGANGCSAVFTCAYADGGASHETKLEEVDYNAHPVGVTLEELAPGTTYDYALVATNDLGTIVGSNGTFTTSPPTPPLAATGGAEGVGPLSASISGTVDPNGYPTSYGFQVGIDTSYGVEVFGEAGSGSEPRAVSLSLVNLQPGTTYHYRLVASSLMGKSYGVDQTFTTPLFATATLSAPVPEPLVASPATALPSKANGGTKPKGSTNAQKLAKALKVCMKKPRKRRAGCKKQARRKYGQARR